MSESEARRSNRRRIATVILVGGAVAMALLLGRSAPTDHALSLDLPPGFGIACELEIAWISAKDELLSGGARLSLPASLPKRVNYSFRAPAGEYRLTVTVLRPKRSVNCNSLLVAIPMKAHRLHLDGSATVIHLSANAHP